MERINRGVWWIIMMMVYFISYFEEMKFKNKLLSYIHHIINWVPETTPTTTTLHPIFFDRVRFYSSSDWSVIVYTSSDWSSARSFSKVTIRSPFISLFLTTTLCDSLDCDCSAARPYRCTWRARKRRPHTHATSVRSTTQARRPRRRWSTSKLTDASMKFQLQSVNYVHFFIEAASIKFWTVKGLSPEPADRVISES